ncbi:hypothetical protein QM306_36565, partial [Burkholderia cenocepacia]|nr:hypothetical protein [Burkholderia cenocepacia]
PLGDPLTEPLIGEAGLVTARIDTDELVKARYDFDVVGHYARADVFSLPAEYHGPLRPLVDVQRKHVRT